MSAPEEVWTARLHAAVDDHPAAMTFDVQSYVGAGRRRVRRRRAASVFATAAAVGVLAVVVAVGTRGGAPQPAVPAVPHKSTLGVGTNGWVAVESFQDPGDIYLVRPGEEPRRLEVTGSDAADDACPVWSPDGTRLLFGRVTGSSDTTSRAELVIVPVGQDGVAGSPSVIGLDGFTMSSAFDAHPCGTWAPDGRWVAFAGTGRVWVVDTRTGAIRHLPDLRPSDLEWRPGTDELAIAGDMGTSREGSLQSTPVRVYSVSTGHLRRLGAVEAAHITWSPDGAALGYTGTETDLPQLGLVDADGANQRVLVADLGPASMHGIGPVWSPTGDRIAYQRRIGCCESSDVVLVDVVGGTATVIEPPMTDGRPWWPFTVSWSPDGTTLLYVAWTQVGRTSPTGLIAVPADTPSEVKVLTDALHPAPHYGWTPIQMWGRQPG